MSAVTLPFVALVAFSLTASLGEALTCYHCFDSFTKTLSWGSADGEDFGESFIRCDKNQNNWNTWTCPPKFPLCVIMSGRAITHYEVVRSCAENNFCAKYVPPPGVRLDYCRECKTDMCNDYLTSPAPPVGPGPLFTFNVNVNLNVTVKKDPLVGNKNKE